MKWYKAASIINSTYRIEKVIVAGKKLCLIRYERQYFALSARCPHAGADLSTGWCESGKIICPFHRYSYNLATGKGSEGQNDYIDTYSVEIKDNNIYIGIPSFWDGFKS